MFEQILLCFIVAHALVVSELKKKKKRQIWDVTDVCLLAAHLLELLFIVVPVSASSQSLSEQYLAPSHV